MHLVVLRSSTLLADREPCNQEVEMGHPVTWFQIQGKDGDALAAFYKKAFAWQMSDAVGGGMQMVAPEKDASGDGIAGGIGASMDGSSGVAVYVNCQNIDAQMAKIEAAGGRRAMPNTVLDGGFGTIAGFLDPAGNWTGLWEPAAKPEAPKKKAAKKTAKKAAKKATKKTAKKATKKAAKKATKKTAKKAAKRPTKKAKKTASRRRK